MVSLDYIREDGSIRWDSAARVGDIVQVQESGPALQTATNYTPIYSPTTPIQALRYSGVITRAQPTPASVASNRLDSGAGQAEGGSNKQPFTIKPVSVVWFLIVLAALFFITAGADIKAMGGV